MAGNADRLSIITLGAALARTSGKIDASIAAALAEYENGVTVKGSVDYVGELPGSGNAAGDAYIVKYQGDSGETEYGRIYIWDGEAWVPGPNSLKLYRDEDGDLCEED